MFGNIDNFEENRNLENNNLGKIQEPTKKDLKNKIVKEVGVNIIKNTQIENYSNDFKDPNLEKYIVNEKHSIFPDLIIFRDACTHILPANGIKESEYKTIVKLFDGMSTGKSKLQISGTEEFKNNVLNAIKKLMTKQLGRDLFLLLEEKSEEKYEIKEFEGNTSYEPESKTILINPKQEPYVFSSVFNTRKRQLVHVPLHLALAHELIHFKHHLDNIKILKAYTQRNPSLHKDFHNLEEQRTITGLLNSLKFNISRDGNFNENFIEINDNYDRFNENNFAMTFGLYHRKDHEGIDLEGQDKLKNILEMKNYELENLDYAYKYFHKIGLTSEAEEVKNAYENLCNQELENSGIKLDKLTFIQEFALKFNIPDLFQRACEKMSHNSYALELIVYYYLNYFDKFDKNILLDNIKKCIVGLDHSKVNEILFKYIENDNALDFISIFLEQGADLNYKDNQGTSLLQKAISKGSIELINYLIQKGAQPTEDDKKEIESIERSKKINAIDDFLDFI